MINGKTGTHEAAQRNGGLAEWHELKADACIAVDGGDLAEGAVCAFCFCDFDDLKEDPPCAWPGCVVQPPHFADSMRDKSNGVVPGSSYAHRSCFERWFSMKVSEGTPFGYCGDV